MALATISGQAVWCLNTFTQLGYTVPMTIMEHNTSNINVAENAINNPEPKNIDVASHFSRENSIRKCFTLANVPSNDKTADLMTKGLNSVAHHRHTQHLGLSQWQRVLLHTFCAFVESILLFTYRESLSHFDILWPYSSSHVVIFL